MRDRYNTYMGLWSVDIKISPCAYATSRREGRKDESSSAAVRFTDHHLRDTVAVMRRCWKDQPKISGVDHLWEGDILYHFIKIARSLWHGDIPYLAAQMDIPTVCAIVEQYIAAMTIGEHNAAKTCDLLYTRAREVW